MELARHSDGLTNGDGLGVVLERLDKEHEDEQKSDQHHWKNNRIPYKVNIFLYI